MKSSHSQHIKHAKEWLRYATDDELNARSILTHKDGAPNGPCFLSQQMSEKYLKGLLIFYGKNIPKIHDLLTLETRILAVEPAIKELHKDLVLLNRYYIITRYPADYPEFSWKDAQEAYEAALRVKDFVLNKIKTPLPTP